MSVTLLLPALLSLACTDPAKAPDGDSGAADSTGTGDSGDSGAGSASAGCGRSTDLRPGGVQQTIDAGRAGGGERGYWLSLPENYDPDRAYPLVLGYPGTSWVGEQIQPYLGLEATAPGRDGAIFAYPDPLWRDFEGWGNYGGWLLGPNAAPADGMEDLVFTEAMLDDLEQNYCVDTARVFVTGHSWGGDMAAVVACFLGDRVRAAAPAAANRPYWFEPDSGEFSCVGSAAVWTFFGVADDHFTWQDYPGQYGDEQDAFWSQERGCDAAAQDLGLEVGACVEHTGCSADTRYCLYGPDTGHQIPDGFAGLIMEWFGGR